MLSHHVYVVIFALSLSTLILGVVIADSAKRHRQMEPVIYQSVEAWR
jgi:hypothetical protein